MFWLAFLSRAPPVVPVVGAYVFPVCSIPTLSDPAREFGSFSSSVTVSVAHT